MKILKNMTAQAEYSTGIVLALIGFQRKGNAMKFNQFLTPGTKKWKAIDVALLGLGFSACATSNTSDSNYALRNNIDSARARCVELARSSGYQEVAVDSVERDGQAAWKVGLVVKKDGKDRKENCQYDASTNRVRMES